MIIILNWNSSKVRRTCKNILKSRSHNYKLWWISWNMVLTTRIYLLVILSQIVFCVPSEAVPLYEGSPRVKLGIVIYGLHSQIAFVVELIYRHVLYVNVDLRRMFCPTKRISNDLDFIFTSYDHRFRKILFYFFLRWNSWTHNYLVLHEGRRTTYTWLVYTLPIVKY